MRRMFASLLFALGVDPVSVMALIGHTDARFTMKVYAKQMRRAPTERDRLHALTEGESLGTDWALALNLAPSEPAEGPPQEGENPA